MKKLRTLAIIILTTLGLRSSAQIVVYRGVQVSRNIGPFQDFRIAETMFVAFDATWTNAVSVSTFKLNGTKYVQVEQHSFNLTFNLGEKAAIWMSLTEYQTFRNASAGTFFTFLYGQNTKLPGAPGGWAPKVLTAKAVESTSRISDSTINLAFDSKDTLAANGAGQTIADFAAALEKKFLSQGYIEPSPLY